MGGPALGLGIQPSHREDRRVEIRVRGLLDLFVGVGEDVRRYRVVEAGCGIAVETGVEALASRVAIQQLAQAVLGNDESMYVAGGVAALAGVEDPTPCTCRDEHDLQYHHLYWWTRYRLSGQLELGSPSGAGEPQLLY
jgi:hypothetical protein